MNAYKSQIREFLATRTGAMRSNLKISQDQMSELLCITPRAYSDLERKKYCLSTSSLLFLLSLMSEEELQEFMKDFKKMIQEADERERNN